MTLDVHLIASDLASKNQGAGQFRRRRRERREREGCSCTRQGDSVLLQLQRDGYMDPIPREESVRMHCVARLACLCSCVHACMRACVHACVRQLAEATEPA